MRNAAIKRDPGIPVYDGTLRKTAMQLDLAVAAHAQPALMLRIRDRAQALLREEKNIVVNDFARIANQDLPDSSCAAAMAKALRRTLVPDPVFAAGAHAGSRLTDAHIRERLDAALDELLPGEIQALAAHLLTRPSATEARTRHLKHLLQDQGSGPVEKAALGRQFNLFCEALADRAKIGSPPPALRALQGWDWDQSLSRQDPPAHRPGRLQRLSAAVSRGARRAFAWLFDPGQAAAYRAQDARAELARASSDFLRTAGKIASQDDSLLVRQARRSRRWRLRYRQARNEPAPAADAQLRAFNENVLRLLKASERYKRACRALGEDACKSLDLATNPVRFHEAAFRDALALMPGAEANALGRACFGRDWASGLLERLEAYRDMAAADAPRAEATAATARRRLAASDKNASVAQAMPLVADAQFLVHRMHNVLKEEPAVRAAAEVVRLLDRHIAGSLGLAANPDAGGIQAGADSNAGAVQAGADSNSIPVQAGADAGRVSVPAVADTMSAPLAAGGEPIAAEAPAAASDREASKQRLLDEIWTLEQRFRPLARKHGYTMDWSRDYFVDAGMSRVSPARRKRLQDAVTDIDRRPPEWLASDALWLAVVRHFQGARHLAA